MDGRRLAELALVECILLEPGSLKVFFGEGGLTDKDIEDPVTLAAVQDARAMYESTGDVPVKELVDALRKRGYNPWEVDEAIGKALSRTGKGWKEPMRVASVLEMLKSMSQGVKPCQEEKGREP